MKHRDDVPERAIHRQGASSKRPVVEDDRLIGHADRPSAETRGRARSQSGSARAIGNGHDAVDTLRRDRDAAHCRVHVEPVANELRVDFVV